MATLNKVMLIGRLTDNPEEPRTLPNSGTRVIRFRFAVGRSRRNEQGGWDKDPNQLYIDCECYSRPDTKRDLVSLIQQYAKKGDSLYLEGRLVYETWDDKQTGQKRSKHKLVVDSLEFLGSRTSDDSGSGSRPLSGGRAAPPLEDSPYDDDSGGPGSSPGGNNDPIPF
ncbi:MAG: single-stranded DNA-binding protein [Gemmataceae bacterium]|nr:single-stranded DNA-binding protein [Gemmata sp.]MDW8196409.1 single-stranded DNA-binding protein [Gemmataceae bacterium]